MTDNWTPDQPLRADATDEQIARKRVEELYYGMWPVDTNYALDNYRDAIVAATKAATVAELEIEKSELRTIVGNIVNHDWIIATAHVHAPSRFGWQVNERDGAPDKNGSQHFKPVPDTFGLTPVEAGLRAIRRPSPESQ